MNLRKVKDNLLNILTICFSSVGVVVLLGILIFVFNRGFKSLSWDLISTDYNATTYVLKSDVIENDNFINSSEDYVFSYRYGIGLKDSKNTENISVVEIVYIDDNSPFKYLKNTQDESIVSLKEGTFIEKIILINEDNNNIYSFAKDGAESMALSLDESIQITSMTSTIGGGGIRGSLITTIYLIILTLIISLPVGIFAAIYLHEFAPKSKFTNIIRSMIDMISGIPSIIFGLVGAMIFIPFSDTLFNSNGGSIISGSLTMSLILLPTIIKTTEEALIVVPDSLRNASLALGASKTQTIFKVVLPNAASGIITATLLSIGRIIGESAALIYAIGTSISDKIILNGKSTSLAVHMWVLLGGENQNYDTACAISIIILVVVFIMNISIKLVSKRLNKLEV